MSYDKNFLLAVAKSILNEVDGIDGGYDPNSYIPPHFVEALRAAIEGEENRINSTPGAVHPMLQGVLNRFQDAARGR